ncbi:MAG: hypothetical protein WCS94_05965 [Verrucomicrobiota bacterium]
MNYTAGGVTYRVEVADELTGPWKSSTSFVEQAGPAANNGDGTETVNVRLKQAVPGTMQKYMRLVVIPTP